MPQFEFDGVRIAYLDEGEGDPILLIHGFASNKQVNWQYPGWVDLLVKDGRRVIAVDNRGHGDSQKFYDPAAYGAPIMAEDARRLLDHLNIEKSRRDGLLDGRADFSISDAQSSEPRPPGPYSVVSDTAWSRGLVILSRLHRRLKQTGSRMFPTEAAVHSGPLPSRPGPIAARLLPACALPGKGLRWTMFPGSSVRVLVAVGTKDDIAGSPQKLADLIPHAEVLDIPGRDHMVAVGDKVHKQGVLAFLNNVEA